MIGKISSLKLACSAQAVPVTAVAASKVAAMRTFNGSEMNILGLVMVTSFHSAKGKTYYSGYRIPWIPSLTCVKIARQDCRPR